MYIYYIDRERERELYIHAAYIEYIYICTIAKVSLSSFPYILSRSSFAMPLMGERSRKPSVHAADRWLKSRYMQERAPRIKWVKDGRTNEQKGEAKRATSISFIERVEEWVVRVDGGVERKKERDGMGQRTGHGFMGFVISIYIFSLPELVRARSAQHEWRHSRRYETTSQKRKARASRFGVRQYRDKGATRVIWRSPY